MRRVLKYVLSYAPEMDIELPLHLRPIDLELQNGQPTLWAIVDSEDETMYRRVFAVFTGMELPEMRFGQILGTIQAPNGLVYHYFIGDIING